MSVRFSCFLFTVIFWWVPVSSTGAIGGVVEPVTFSFKLPDDARNPFARELWADVSLPSGRMLRLPVYYDGHGRFAVRARAEEKGVYALGKITENEGGQVRELTASVRGRAKHEARSIQSLPAVRCDPDEPTRFILSDGNGYTPIGTNLAWAPQGRLDFYKKSFAEFERHGLNWARVWMCHWGRLNLDWSPQDMGPSPAHGFLDLRVAASWDKLLQQSEAHGVYVQLVLQHHGQYTTGANPNWAENPWNVANGGFLHTPAEFFTSPLARELTAQKYRYIVARWGYSAAVMAWELFNEVHWVDALSKDRNVEAVAAWHREMAAVIRSVDVYGHLVTTSTEDLHSAIYADMDFFQPHLYSPEMIASAQRFEARPDVLGRPVFYGEVGDDHMRLQPGVKESGLALVPPVWASVMGEGRYPAQIWVGDQLLAKKRIGELGAVARFLRAMHQNTRGPFSSFSPVVQSAERRPLVIGPGQHWQRRPAPRIAVPVDGRYNAAVADVPHYIVGSSEAVADGYPSKFSLLVDLPVAITATARLANGGPGGATMRVNIDGQLLAEEVWTELLLSKGEKAKPRPRMVHLNLPAGVHEISFENTGGNDWVEFGALDLGVDIPVISAVGKRADSRVVVWFWHREGVFAARAPAPVTDAVVVIDALPAGDWKVTWWDSLKGIPAETKVYYHGGGDLRLPVPPLSRHRALMIER